MTNQQHPITPPPELVQQWLGEYFGCTVSGELNESQRYLATASARWGADQELEACCDHLKRSWSPSVTIDNLRAARRPKPPSLKEQALKAQQRMWDGGVTREDWELVRRALEQLDD